MDNSKRPTIDGRSALLEFARQFPPRFEHRIVDLERLLRRLGFAVSDADEDRVIVTGPSQRQTVCRTLVLYGGAMRVRHLEVVKALERILEVGLPVWASETEQFQWHCKQLEQCEPFEIQAPKQFESREEMQAHIDNCPICAPAFELLLSAINSGSARTQDAHLLELIERSHADAQAALKFYEGIRDAQRGAWPLAAEKPRKRTQEVSA